MGFSAIITFCILIIIVFVLITILRIATFWTDFGVANIEPKELTLFIWHTILRCLLVITVVSIAIFLVLYLVWVFVRNVIGPIPIFGTIIWAIVRSLTPFRELNHFGIFSLFDALFTGNWRGVRSALSRMYIMGISSWRRNDKWAKLPGEEAAEKNVEENKLNDEPLDESQFFTNSQIHLLRDDYLRCKQENNSNQKCQQQNFSLYTKMSIEQSNTNN